MKTLKNWSFLLLAAFSCNVAVAGAVPTNFTYQGMVTYNGQPANGLFDFAFEMSQTQPIPGGFYTNGVPVTNGLFTVEIDPDGFQGGFHFDGSAHTLSVGVKTNGGSTYTGVGPGRQLPPSPYSLYSLTAPSASRAPVSGVSGIFAPAQMPANAAYVNSNQTFSAQQAFAARVNLSNTVHLYTNAYMNDRDVQLRGDAFHGLGWYGASKTFAGVNVNGPVLYGGSGGALGAVSGSSSNIALSWDDGRNVTVPSLLSVSNLGVTGSARLNEHFLFLRGEGDGFHGLARAVASTNFSDSPDGPVLFGCSGGSLGTMCTPALALSWNYLGNVFTDPSARNNRSLLPGLTFGPDSGEGISSRRTAGAGQFAIDFYAANAIRMTIDNSGNVGIGQTSPTAKLDVSGAIKATRWLGPGTLSWQSVADCSIRAEPNQGYIASSPVEVSVILPPSPAIGDIICVSGAGGGNWEVDQNANQRIDARNLHPFSPGTSWTTHGISTNWISIASSADGTKLAAAVDGGLIYTSTDSGTNWTPRVTAGNMIWRGIASSADGSKLVANAYFGNIYTSTDSGTNWTLRTNAGAWAWVHSSPDGSKLYAGTDFITSDDSGVTWRNVTGPPGSRSSVACLASSWDGKKLVIAAGDGSYSYLWTSTDSGTNWVKRQRAEGIGFGFKQVTSSGDGTKLAAIEDSNYIWTSTDSGTNWTGWNAHILWSCLAASANGNRLLAFTGSVGGGAAYLSMDAGATWTRDSGSPGIAACCAMSADGTKLVSGVGGSSIVGYISTLSPVFSSATTTTTGITGCLVGKPWSAVELQYIGNNVFIPISHEGTNFVAY